MGWNQWSMVLILPETLKAKAKRGGKKNNMVHTRTPLDLIVNLLFLDAERRFDCNKKYWEGGELRISLLTRDAFSFEKKESNKSHLVGKPEAYFKHSSFWKKKKQTKMFHVFWFFLFYFEMYTHTERNYKRRKRENSHTMTLLEWWLYRFNHLLYEYI